MKKSYTIKCYSCGKILLQYLSHFGIFKTKHIICDECKEKYPKLNKKNYKKKIEKYENKIVKDNEIKREKIKKEKKEKE